MPTPSCLIFSFLSSIISFRNGGATSFFLIGNYRPKERAPPDRRGDRREVRPDRHSGEQRRGTALRGKAGGYQRRAAGEDFPNQHLLLLFPDQGGPAQDGGRGKDHQHHLGHRLQGKPDAARLLLHKGAIVSFTRSLALSVAERGILVNAVAPGPVWTPLIPASFPEEKVARFGADVTLKRAGQPVEIAHSYVFLASEGGSYMTGQVLHPNGGTIVGGLQYLHWLRVVCITPTCDRSDTFQATADPQALHLRASTGICSRHSGQFFTGSAGEGLSSALVIRKTTKAMKMKSMIVPRRCP